MDEKRKRSSTTPLPARIGFIQSFLEQLRLSWALLRDNRVPILLKLIPIVAIAYVISPVDLVPDIFPVLGQLDDVGILMASLSLFNTMAPADVVEEHLSRLRTGRKFKVSRDTEGIVIDMEPQSEAVVDSEPEDENALGRLMDPHEPVRKTNKKVTGD